MKLIAFLYCFFALQIISCQEMATYKAILKDIKSSEIFEDFIEEKNICSNLQVSDYLYGFCWSGYLFQFDYPDINDYVRENCYNQKQIKNTKYVELKKLSDKGKSCLSVGITETFSNKIVIELTPVNRRISEELYYLYEILPDKSIVRLEEMVLIVD